MKEQDKDPRCTTESPVEPQKGKPATARMPTRRSPVTEACNHLERSGEGAMSIRLKAHCDNIEDERLRAQAAWVEQSNELENLKNATQHSGYRFEAFADAVAIGLGMDPGADCDAILRELNKNPPTAAAVEPMHIPPSEASNMTLGDICNAFRGAGIHVNGHDEGATPDNVMDFVQWVLRKFSGYQMMLNDICAAVEPATGMSLKEHSILEMVNELIKRKTPLGSTRLQGLTAALVSVGKIAGVYQECLKLRDDADATNIVEAVRKLKESEESHQHAHKQICGQFGDQINKLTQLVSEYGGGIPDEPVIALEDLLVNLRANQMPEGFRDHADVLVRSNARYEAALVMIQNAVVLVKDA